MKDTLTKEQKADRRADERAARLEQQKANRIMTGLIKAMKKRGALVEEK